MIRMEWTMNCTYLLACVRQLETYRGIFCDTESQRTGAKIQICEIGTYILRKQNWSEKSSLGR